MSKSKYSRSLYERYCGYVRSLYDTDQDSWIAIQWRASFYHSGCLSGPSQRKQIRVFNRFWKEHLRWK